MHSAYGQSSWNEGGEQRLLVSMLLATVLVAGVLSQLKLPDVPAWSPVLELAVRIISEQPVEPAEEELAPTVPATLPAETASEVEEPAPTAGQQATEAGAVDNDWDSASERAIENYLDSQLEDYGYVNGDLAEKRRRLSGRYQPGTHEQPRPIWENIEKDTLGRSVLRSGDCFKVLDDPNVGNRYTFETFDQHIIQCAYIRRPPRNLPWVDDIRGRYEYLRNPGGYVEDEEE